MTRLAIVLLVALTPRRRARTVSRSGATRRRSIAAMSARRPPCAPRRPTTRRPTGPPGNNWRCCFVWRGIEEYQAMALRGR